MPDDVSAQERLKALIESRYQEAKFAFGREMVRASTSGAECAGCYDYDEGRMDAFGHVLATIDVLMADEIEVGLSLPDDSGSVSSGRDNGDRHDPLISLSSVTSILEQAMVKPSLLTGGSIRQALGEVYAQVQALAEQEVEQP